MRIQSLKALIAGCVVAQGANAQSLDPIKNYCFRFDHQCMCPICGHVVMDHRN